MLNKLTRRDFIGTTAMAGAALSLGTLGAVSRTSAATAAASPFKTKLYRGLGCRIASVKETAEKAAKCGYDGLEMWEWDVDIAKAREARAIAEANGLRIHSLVRAWTNLNNADTFDKDVESVKKALRVARAYGSDAILWVPCRVAPPAVNPWDFQIEFDPKTLRVKKVAAGDNAPYADYIRLQNEASAATEKAIEQLIPVAAEEGITIALENVWNQLWVKPEFAAAFVKQFDNLWVKMYFDLGNNCKYAPTEDWLRAMGKSTLAKLHIKDFAIDKTDLKQGGKFVPIGYGSIDWVSVRKTIEEVGYNGWVTLEDVSHYSNEEHIKILNAFFDGKLTREFAESVKKYK